MRFRAEDRASVPSRSFRFVPHRSASPGREDPARVRGLLVSALRAAHGLGGGFALRLDSGPSPQLELRTASPALHRWVTRVLSVVYGPRSWRSSSGLHVPETSRGRFAQRRALPGEFPSVTRETGSVLQAVVAAFSSIAERTVLELRLEPRSAPVRRPWLLRQDRPLRPEPVDPYWRRRSAPPFSAKVRSEPETVPDQLLWSSELELWGPMDPEDRTASAIDAAWRLLDGRGLRWKRVAPSIGRGPRFLMQESELLAVLPSPQETLLTERSPVVAAEGLPVGRDAAGTVVHVPVEPENGRHLVVLGETGMGKSSLLVTLARRAARFGSVVVLDPLGETADAIEAELFRAGRTVRRVAPGALGGRTNVLAGLDGNGRGGGSTTDRRVDALVHALRRVRSSRYSDSAFWGPRLEEMLGRSLRAAASVEGGTLEDALGLLNRTAGPWRRTAPGTAPGASELLERVRERPDDAEGARRLLYEVVRDATLREMLCARSPDVRVGELLEPGAVAVVSGEAKAVGESTARYLLSVYLALVWSELLCRPHGTKAFVFLDEAQWFVHESLGEMLRLGRRFNAHVVLATQTLASLPPDVAEAVRTNVADQVVFRGSPEDARELSRSLPGVTPEELSQLPRGSAAVLVGKGESVRWARTARLPGQASATPSSTDRSSVAAPGQTTASRQLVDPVPSERSQGHDSERRPTDLPWDLVVFEARRLLQAFGGAGPRGEVLLSRDDLSRQIGREVSVGEWRHLGGRLGRAGAIRRIERSPRGNRWQVDRGLAVTALAGGGGPHEARDGSSPVLATGEEPATPAEGRTTGASPPQGGAPAEQQQLL